MKLMYSFARLQEFAIGPYSVPVESSLLPISFVTQIDIFKHSFIITKYFIPYMS